MVKSSLSAGCVLEKETGYYGNNIKVHKKVESQEDCLKLVKANKKALFWTYKAKAKECRVKKSKKGKKPFPGHVSGNRECAL